jgi:hypothetical protein
MKQFSCRSIRIAQMTLIIATLTRAAVAQQLPSPWQDHIDIGDVGRPGDVRATRNGTYFVSGAGDDIGGTADAFHYLYTQIVGGDDVNARVTVTRIKGTEPWAKVGLMLRSDILPGSTNHFLLASRSRGIAYQRRLTNDGPTLHTTVSASSELPVTFEVMRRGGYTVLNVMRDGVWQEVAALSASDWTLVGLAVTSHNRDVLATGTFTNVLLDTDPDPKVRIMSPNAGEVIMAGTPYTIQWIQTLPNPATVSYSVDDGQSWTVVPGCASIVATSCTWSNPGPATEAARIRVVLENTDDRAAWAATGSFAIR